mmetsp:Transcript_35275/g.89266  ORF Transcript_35275/g.89266 Transcript_35275/m.89266 type:complete len:200 (-) Transcript_35275:242-841(-)
MTLPWPCTRSSRHPCRQMRSHQGTMRSSQQGTRTTPSSRHSSRRRAGGSSRSSPTCQPTLSSSGTGRLMGSQLQQHLRGTGSRGMVQRHQWQGTLHQRLRQLPRLHPSGRCHPGGQSAASLLMTGSSACSRLVLHAGRGVAHGKDSGCHCTLEVGMNSNAALEGRLAATESQQEQKAIDTWHCWCMLWRCRWLGCALHC